MTLTDIFGNEINPRKSSVRVLLLDDDPIQRELIGDRLEAWGFQVDYAANGQEALGKLQKSDYDILLSDTQLNGDEMGYDVAESAARLHPVNDNLAILAMSGNAHVTEYKRGWEEVGAYDFLNKTELGVPHVLAQKIYSAIAAKKGM